MRNNQPRAVENLITHLVSFSSACGLFDEVIRDAGEYFQEEHPRRRQRPGTTGGQSPSAPQGFVLVERQTGREKDSGVFILPADEWREREQEVQDAYRSWWTAAAAALTAAGGLRHVRERFCPELPDAWFAELLADLRFLAGLRHPTTYGSGTGLLRTGVDALPVEAQTILRSLDRRRMSLLDAIPKKPRGPMPPGEILKMIGGDGLRLSDLPPDIGPSHLRGVDHLGYVWVREWARVDHDSTPEHYATREAPVGGWYSPRAAHPNEGDLNWERLFADVSPPWSPSAELRLSADGLLALDLLEGQGTVDIRDSENASIEVKLLSYTQDELDGAIREYRASRSAKYSELKRAIAGGNKAAKKAATTLFGRNAIARELRCKAPAMVTKSPVWQAIKSELRMTKARPLHKSKIGLGMAVEAASLAGASEVGQELEINELLQRAARLPPEVREQLQFGLERGDVSSAQALSVIQTYLEHPDCRQDM